MRVSRATVVGIVVTAALVTGGAAYAARSSTPTASKTDTIVSTSANINLSATGGVETTIATLNLPPGAFVLHASGDVVNFGPSDFTRCQIVVASTQVAAVSTLVGDPAASGAQGPAGLLSPFALVGGAVNATTTTELAALRCEHDTTNGSTPLVDGGASLWAHKTTGLKLATE
jgi:hypothetical protein